MNHVFVKLLSIVALALAACGTTSGVTDTEIRPFTADDLDQNPIDLGKHLGKDVVFLSFWATYCEPCKAEMPFLQRFHDKFRERGLTIVSISLDGPDTQAGVAPYIRKQGYTFPVVIDRTGAIAQSLNPTGTAPYAILVGKDGKVKKRVAGFQASEADALEHELEAFLAAP